MPVYSRVPRSGLVVAGGAGWDESVTVRCSKLIEVAPRSVIEGDRMARACEICGKSPKMGNQVETRGKAKYLGGVGTKITGISRRKFRPNLQTVKITTSTGTTRTVRVCTRCISKGFVRKAVRQRPFKLQQATPKPAAAR